MFLKRILPIGLIILTIIFGIWRYNNPPCVENSDYIHRSSWLGDNPFEIKLERIPERCGLFPALGGANYIFSSHSGDSENWQQIFTSHHDDLIDIRSDNVRVLDEKKAYSFIIQKFASTTDGGKSWDVWEIKKNLTNNDCCQNKLIRDVYLDVDGSGFMRLSSLTNRDSELTELRTTDFGKTWNP
jgi:hypothetical protein